MFHFLTEAQERAAYRAALAAALPRGAHAVIGTFASDGPERCSGLPVQRYCQQTLVEAFAAELRPLEARAERHITPAGAEQSFVFVRFERR